MYDESDWVIALMDDDGKTASVCATFRTAEQARLHLESVTPASLRGRTIVCSLAYAKHMRFRYTEPYKV